VMVTTALTLVLATLFLLWTIQASAKKNRWVCCSRNKSQWTTCTCFITGNCSSVYKFAVLKLRVKNYEVCSTLCTLIMCFLFWKNVFIFIYCSYSS
jgi:hypothetical protein